MEEDWRVMGSGHGRILFTGSTQGAHHQGQHEAPQFLSPT